CAAGSYVGKNPFCGRSTNALEIGQAMLSGNHLIRVPATPESTMTNLAHRLLASASADPSALGIRLDDVTLSYADLASASCRLAKRLTDRGLQPGDRVGVMLPN